MKTENYNNLLDRLRPISYWWKLKIFLSKELQINEDLITENNSMADIMTVSIVKITPNELYEAIEKRFDVDLSEFDNNNTMKVIWLSNRISEMKRVL